MSLCLFFFFFFWFDIDLTVADINLANTLVDEFPCRPHWTKNTRDVLTRAKKNLDPDVSGRQNISCARFTVLTCHSTSRGSTPCARTSIRMDCTAA